MQVKLHGITWDHSRGLLPLVATAQRFHELHPEVTIEWQSRSLQAFADQPLEELATRFDLLVIDHPFVGYAAAHHTLSPLTDFGGYLSDQETNTVGKSHQSYFFAGCQWALAIDAATPVGCCRQDLLEPKEVQLPETWDDLIELASRGFVLFPAIPIDSLMHFYMLCLALGAELFPADDHVVTHEVGIEALTRLKRLSSLCDPVCLRLNPIGVYETMTRQDRFVYCPFAYGYVNYSRLGYSQHLLTFGEVVRLEKDTPPLTTTLGGTGLAVSSQAYHQEIAFEYLRFVADPICQKTIYTQSGGQPGHRTAWLDPDLNKATENFFHNTLPVLDRAYLRPRYDGYLKFQDLGGGIIHSALRGELKRAEALDHLDRVYRQSKQENV